MSDKRINRAVLAACYVIAAIAIGAVAAITPTPSATRTITPAPSAPPRDQFFKDNYIWRDTPDPSLAPKNNVDWLVWIDREGVMHGFKLPKHYRIVEHIWDGTPKMGR